MLFGSRFAAGIADGSITLAFRRCESRRAVLAASDRLSDDDVADLARKLDRMDRVATAGPWTLAVGYRLSPRGRALLPRLVDGGVA